MQGIIAAALGLADKVAGIIGTDTARKYVELVRKGHLEIIEEEGKGDAADDSKIETLYRQLEVNLEALNSEYAIHQATPK